MKKDFELIAVSPGVYAKARKPKPVVERVEPDDETQERRPPRPRSNPRGFSTRDNAQGSDFRKYDREERLTQIYDRAFAALRARPVNLEGFGRADRAKVEAAMARYFERAARGIAAKCLDNPDLYDVLLASVLPFDKVLDGIEQVQYEDESRASYLSGGRDLSFWLDPITRGKNDRYWNTPAEEKPELETRLHALNCQNALKFKNEHPEYYPCDENNAAFAEYCDRHGLKYYAPVMISFIVSRLRTFGLLKDKPVVNLDGIGPYIPTQEEQRREREKELAQQQNRYYNDKTFLVSGGRGYSEAEVDKMSGDELGKLLPKINTTARVGSHNLGGIF